MGAWSRTKAYPSPKKRQPRLTEEASSQESGQEVPVQENEMVEQEEQQEGIEEIGDSIVSWAYH